MIEQQTKEIEFINELKKKIQNLQGHIIDIIHNIDNYYVVEDIINFIIDYFINKGSEVKSK